MNDMKFAFSLFLVSLSLVLGFFYAGILGAFLFAVCNTFTWVIFTKQEIKQNVLRIVLSLCALSCVGYILMLVFGLLGADKLVHYKIEGIKNELIKAGYKPIWFIISQKRYSFFNDLLGNAVKSGKSKHLQGKAIDLYVIDVNADGKYDKTDFELIQQASQRYVQTNAYAKGNVIHYFGKGYLTQHMIHIDIE